MAVEETGAPDGLPVFLMHGTPGSRGGIKPRGIVLHRLGVRLICYDRPGYGASDRRKGRRVVDAAADVRAIADALDLDRFAVVGRSGGGPHALAVAASLPDRVNRAAVLVSLAPADAPGLDWYGGMGESNMDEYQLADLGHRALMASLTSQADRLRRDPESQIAFLEKELSGPDRRVVDNVAMRRQLAESWAEAVRLGAEGWIDDALAFRRGWGFDPATIRVPVRLWHGTNDQFSPVAHTRWLAARIPGAEIQVQPGVGHFAAVEILPAMLAWLTDTAGATIRTGAGRAPGIRAALPAAP
ncbi:alpha/beta fold hydrolase [Phytohabitans kaempferiae]|uniref:Alpha/beta fold hydrolase n=1 Tax=Phytohabitans kaempferiae TaxID=1620943 RepID=A0ABV6MDU2_9ACTN